MYQYPEINCFSSELVELRNKTSSTIFGALHEAKESVAKKIVNKYGYPNNIEVYTFQSNNDCHFVDVVSGDTVAKVELDRFFAVKVWIHGDICQ